MTPLEKSSPVLLELTAVTRVHGEGERRLVLADGPNGTLDSHTGEAVMRLLRARVDAGAAGRAA